MRWRFCSTPQWQIGLFPSKPLKLQTLTDFGNWKWHFFQPFWEDWFMQESLWLTSKLELSNSPFWSKKLYFSLNPFTSKKDCAFSHSMDGVAIWHSLSSPFSNVMDDKTWFVTNGYMLWAVSYMVYRTGWCKECSQSPDSPSNELDFLAAGAILC